MQIEQQIVIYGGLHLYLSTSNTDLFYKYINQIVEEDKTSNKRMKYFINCDYINDYISTNMIHIFLEMFNQLLITSKPDNNSCIIITITEEDNEKINEILVTFNNQNYCIKERTYVGESHDTYIGESSGKIYDPPYIKTEGNIKNFLNDLSTKIKSKIGG